MSRPYFTTVPYSGALGQKEFTNCPSSWAAGGSFTTFDGLSRPVKVVDGGGGESDYAYNQNDVLSTVAGNGAALSVSRQEQRDGMGRLQSVCEITAGNGIGGNWPGGACGQTYTNGGALTGYLTTYANSYNVAAQSPLMTVTQNAQSGNGSKEETRTLQYDQLGRLTSEVNPETQQHATAYTYDTAACGSFAGDMVERQDPNGNTTCYSRDSAHRVTAISYSGPNPTDNKYFVYGTSALESLGCCNLSNVNGRLAEAYTGSPSSHKTDEVFGYTSLGQLEVAGESTPGSAGWYQAWEEYYPDGARQSLTLENNLSQALVSAITYYADGEGRPTGVTDGSAHPPVTAATWLPLGLQSMTFGSTDGHTDTDTYGFDANTGRLTSYSFSANGSSDSGTLNWLANGQLALLTTINQLAAGDNGMQCAYAHDDMGRLGSANCGSSSNQVFIFDPFGNVCKVANAGTSFCPTYNTYNQIAAGANYDLNGNARLDPTGTGLTNSFDAENKPVGFQNATVVFDANGRAVEETGGGSIHQFLYGPDGAKLAVMNGQTLVRADVPLPGGAEAVYGTGGLMYYRHADLLGSSRLATTQAGTVYSASAFAPFGEAIATTGTQDRSFTGQKQDIANGQAPGSDGNGNYDFLAREYSPTQSRWWSPDPAGLAAVDPNRPQTWNRYAYTNGTPLSAVDPLGLQPCKTASLDKQKKGANADSEFGPYDPGEDEAATPPDPSTYYCLDGAEIDFDLGDMLSGGAFSGGGSSSTLLCPAGGCDQTVNSPVNNLPYKLQPGSNGWYYTARNGEEVDEPDLWEELNLPDFNLLLAGQPTRMLALQWNLGGSTAVAPGRPPFQEPLPPSAPATITSSIAYSHSHAAFLSCEYGHTLGNEEMTEAWAKANGLALVAILSGNAKVGGLALAGIAVIDVGGAAVINRGCSAAIYGGE